MTIQIQKLTDENDRLKDDLKMSERRIDTLEDALRSFTSGSHLDFDETFEGILRNEFT